MYRWLFNNKLIIAGVLIGAIAGFLYWNEIGCSSGICMITSKWHNSTAYGALMGGLVLNMFKKSPVPGGEKKVKENE